jgi:hypothetical protein
MAILPVGIGPSKRRQPKASEDPPSPAQVGGIISERRAGTDRNGGRDQIGMVGGIKSE